MGTSNFFYNDTLYALDDSGEENYFLYEDTRYNIKEALGHFKDLKHTDVTFDGDSYAEGSGSFDGVVVVECYGRVYIESPISSESIQFSVRQHIVLRGGYYSGFNLDRYYKDEEDAYHEDMSEIEDDFDWYCDRELNLEGLFDEDDEDADYEARQAYINNVIKPKFEEQLKGIEQEFDEVYHSLGDQFFYKYEVTARFSNGETHYSRV